MEEKEYDKLELVNRKKLTMSAVSSVDGFSEQLLNLTVNGIKVKVLGTNIKITSYNKDSGILSADGEFGEIKYGAKKQPIVKKLFK